jgi:mRNA interferase MazF
MQGDLGKPRPALIIQADYFDEHPTVTVLPLTSTMQATPLFRVSVEPGELTGLRETSQVMVDKAMTIQRSKVGKVVGRLDDEAMLSVNRLLAVFVGIA